MVKTQITSSEEFWNYYFKDYFINLKRDKGVYIGEVYEHSSQVSGPLGLIKEIAKKRIEVSSATLKQYDYFTDKRFSLISVLPSNLSKAFTAVLEKTYTYREPAPFGKQRMSELFVLLEDHYQLNSATDLTISTLEGVLKQMVESYSREMIQPIAALAWFLGERHQISSAEVLISIIQNSKYMSNSTYLIHFTAVNAAFNALWKINPKLNLPDLIKLMKDANESGRGKFASLFTRLLSTNEMLSFDYCGKNYLNPDYWAVVVESYKNSTQLDWDQFDTNALFWEIRYLAALRLSPNNVHLMKLLNDEVGVVAELVRQRNNRVS
jgi:hypothetical protein